MIVLLILASLFLSPTAQETTPEAEPVCKSHIAIFSESENTRGYFLIDGDTFESTQLLEDMGGRNHESHSLSWSPDGSTLLLYAQPEEGTAADGGIYGYDVASGDSSLLIPGLNVRGEWSPEGNFIAYYTVDTGQFVANVMQLDTLDVKTFSEPALTDFAWGADDETLYLMQNDAGYISWFTWNVNDPEAELVSIPEFYAAAEVNASPDGETLAVINWYATAIDLVDPATFTGEALEVGAIYPESLVWSPDSSAFAYAIEKQIFIHTMDGETTELALPEDLAIGWVNIIDWSPDGERLLITITEDDYYAGVYVTDGTDIQEILPDVNTVVGDWSPCLVTESEEE